MRLVDGEQGDATLAQQLQKVFGERTFGRHVEQIDIACNNPALGLELLLSRQCFGKCDVTARLEFAKPRKALRERQCVLLWSDARFHGADVVGPGKSRVGDGLHLRYTLN